MKTLINIYNTKFNKYLSKKALLCLTIAYLVSGCFKSEDTALNRVLIARDYYNIFHGIHLSVAYDQKESYKLYKEVFKGNRAIMTYKHIGHMYSLGLSYEKDKAFLKTLKETYMRERKITTR